MSQALFPAWRPGAAGRAAFAMLSQRLQEARPSDAPSLQLRRADQWHATLCFIGHDVGHLATPPVLDAFAAAATCIPSHTFTLDRLVYWRRSGAVVALPHDCPALQALCDATRDAIRRCGITPEEVTRQPHVTLAFLPRGLDAQPWLDTVDCGIGPLTVDSFELLFNPGGRYEVIGQWPLTGAALPPPPRQDALFR